MEPARQSQSPLPPAADFAAPGPPPAPRRHRALLPCVLPLAAGLGLRLFLLKALFAVNGDSLLYGDLAKNLLLHGRYAFHGGGGLLYPTLIRLPGYPLFLAACFRLFGMENYFAVACVQIGLDLAACLLLAGLAYRMVPPPRQRRAALATLWLAALCPFTASYAVAPLAEAPTLFALALALWAMARFHDAPAASPSFWTGPGWGNALLFTFAVTWAALLRPDGALAALAFAPALLLGLPRPRLAPRRLARMTLVCALLALAPFAAWTARNWRVFHVVQPLAPRLAIDPGEPTQDGWESWVRTWCLDFVSTYSVYWNVPGDQLDVSQLPARAFDSPAQRAETVALANDYNRGGHELTAAIDARFAQLARERTAAHPLRSYLLLPLGRVADMWLRPRVENLSIDLDWWLYAHHHFDTGFSWAYALLNAFYLLLAAAALWLRPRFWLPLLAYLFLRSAMLLTIAAPEARYTLECFPMLFALGGVALATGFHRCAD